MGEVINLNKARKAKGKAAARAKAVENRAKFGRTRAEKAHDAAERARRDRAVDDSKRD
ncbi:DUF4169 family protein [Sphingomonas sp.]|uniref:DUF4169 family protein n=1 Tax=Sphingomonas sp. TaxID=28214 RepID=UPI001EB7462F|nr:DUF4169 family protein [Sphingomonas sp.]MBX3595376.1 DUF4169 family protein [Sphingomonas sp.]